MTNILCSYLAFSKKGKNAEEGVRVCVYRCVRGTYVSHSLEDDRDREPVGAEHLQLEAEDGEGEGGGAEREYGVTGETQL